MGEDSIDGYCSLDDSTRVVWGKGLVEHMKGRDTRTIPLPIRISRGIDAYVNSMYIPPNRYESLVILRPDMAEINESILYEFVNDRLEGRLLVCCKHYAHYRSFRGMEDKGLLEFTTKDMRSSKKYSKSKKEVFSQAHHESQRISDKVRSHLFPLKNWDGFVDALRHGKASFYLKGIQLHLEGFKLK